MKNAQKPEKIALGSLLRQLKEWRFVIPDFRREFEWRPWDIRDLLKSMLLDYYIGTLLSWKETDNVWGNESMQIPQFLGDLADTPPQPPAGVFVACVESTSLTAQ
ncbi:MAG: DUF262 domain-containing protein [Thiotrichales bacterium]|nr:MAG: DUF262 domain-containing protein [Thiotrichales bacterium]